MTCSYVYDFENCFANDDQGCLTDYAPEIKRMMRDLFRIIPSKAVIELGVERLGDELMLGVLIKCYDLEFTTHQVGVDIGNMLKQAHHELCRQIHSWKDNRFQFTPQAS